MSTKTMGCIIDTSLRTDLPILVSSSVFLGSVAVVAQKPCFKTHENVGEGLCSKYTQHNENHRNHKQSTSPVGKRQNVVK